MNNKSQKQINLNHLVYTKSKSRSKSKHDLKNDEFTYSREEIFESRTLSSNLNKTSFLYDKLENCKDIKQNSGLFNEIYKLGNILISSYN